MRKFMFNFKTRNIYTQTYAFDGYKNLVNFRLIEILLPPKELFAFASARKSFQCNAQIEFRPAFQRW